MKPRRASSTAQLVALWRALADQGATSVPGFQDPYARAFLRGGFRLAHAVSQRALAALPAAQRARATEGFDAIPIRVAVIDRLLLEAVGAGCRQVVMLGAGFDTRAWRLGELTGTTVFGRRRVEAAERGNRRGRYRSP
jgi:methyltransferase (TIGR00027 family)